MTHWQLWQLVSSQQKYWWLINKSEVRNWVIDALISGFINLGWKIHRLVRWFSPQSWWISPWRTTHESLKWVSSPQWVISGLSLQKIPLITPVISHLRFVGSEPPSTYSGFPSYVGWHLRSPKLQLFFLGSAGNVAQALRRNAVASMIPSSGFKLGPGALEGSLKIS